MKRLVVMTVLVVMAGCQDRYRYKCQDPSHFQDAECQRPKCLFTQTCPDYLVAPILEKQINAPQQQPASEPAAQR